MSGEKKPSSLRIRIDRARKTFGKRMNRAKLAVGSGVVVLAAIGLYLAF